MKKKTHIEQLQDYFYGFRRVNISKMALKVGYSRAHLTQVIRGRARISANLAISLEHETCGALKAKDLMLGALEEENNKK